MMMPWTKVERKGQIQVMFGIQALVTSWMWNEVRVEDEASAPGINYPGGDFRPPIEGLCYQLGYFGLSFTGNPKDIWLEQRVINWPT